jgi:acyl carrier protein
VSKLETIVKANLEKVLRRNQDTAAELDMEADLAYGYGLTSLDIIMLMSGICQDAGVPLTALAEDDIGALKTPADIVAVLGQKAPA